MLYYYVQVDTVTYSSLSTNAMGSNVTAAWKAHKRGAYFGNPCYTQIHPTCIPVSGDHQSKLTLMSESLRNDGRIWVPAKKEDVEAIRQKKKKPTDHCRSRQRLLFGASLSCFWKPGSA
jgi:aspartate oxidase